MSTDGKQYTVDSLSLSNAGVFTLQKPEVLMMQHIICLTPNRPSAWSHAPDKFNGSDVTYIHTTEDRFIATPKNIKDVMRELEALRVAP